MKTMFEAEDGVNRLVVSMTTEGVDILVITGKDRDTGLPVGASVCLSTKEAGNLGTVLRRMFIASLSTEQKAELGKAAVGRIVDGLKPAGDRRS